MRLIDADKIIYRGQCTVDNPLRSGLYITPEDIDEMPTIEAEPIRSSEWINDGDGFYYCDECGFEIGQLHRKTWYCGGCGAKMK